MKFRKKPVVIEASQFSPDKDEPWPQGVLKKLGVEVSGHHGDPDEMIAIIQTLEGDHIVNPGDWVITGVKGERYPCAPDIFAATYESVEE